MHFHVRIHRWVLWWFYLGVAGGVVALTNILGRDLSRTQDKVILLIGVAHWALGGLVCYACDAIRIAARSQKPNNNEPPRVWERQEWHPASDFLLPGNRKSLLPPRHWLSSYK
jgi:hypothetical protein